MPEVVMDEAADEAAAPDADASDGVDGKSMNGSGSERSSSGNRPSDDGLASSADEHDPVGGSPRAAEAESEREDVPCLISDSSDDEFGPGLQVWERGGGGRHVFLMIAVLHDLSSVMYHCQVLTFISLAGRGRERWGLARAAKRYSCADCKSRRFACACLWKTD